MKKIVAFGASSSTKSINKRFSVYASNQFDIISGISTGGLYILSDDICVLGDLNQDNLIDVSDIITLVNIILEIYPKNAYFNCSGNLNNDLGFNISDIIYLINQILEG